MTTTSQGKAVRTSFWGVAAFYMLIAFEFLYMAGPFAVYFYSVYRPALNFFNQSPELAWLIRFFMPHVAETSSAIINIHNYLGGLLAVLGFISFCIGAFQVYFSKLAERGAVTGGIYNYIRHPQYASFIVCSFGLLILWPRYIVLIMFVTMLFAYYMLARAEERECEMKFGKTYIDYKKRTNMFIPFKIPFLDKIPSLPKSRVGKVFALLGIYILTLTVSISIATGLNNLTINSLYAVYTKDSATISMCEIESNKLQNILDIALSDEEVKDRIATAKGENTKFFNYVLPSEWYIAEIPMNGIGYMGYHSSWSNYNRNQYKIIFTKADMRSNDITGKRIIQNVTKRRPIVEVWVNIAEGKVVDIMDMPERVMYENIPVALY